MPFGTVITWGLAGEYLVTGKVTGFEYEALPGAEVTVTNLRTNEDATVDVDEDGTYSVDLGDTSAYPAGYALGDELLISITHRDTTRTWKRRVSGASLEQDVHLTHGTWKGALRKAKLLTTETFTSPSGTTLTLRDSVTKGVLRVTQNGAEIDGWDFDRPATITLPEQVSTSDVLEADRYTYASEADAKTCIVEHGDAPVRNATARYYATPLGTRIPELQEISEALAAASLRDRYFSGADRADEDAKNLRTWAEARLDEIRNGTRGLTDQDGAYLTPTAQTTTTPRSSTTPTRRFSTFNQTRVDL